MPLTKTEMRNLKIAIALLHDLTTLGPEGHKCGVADEHKEAVRLFVQTWVIPKLEYVALDPEQRQLLGLGFLDRTSPSDYGHIADFDNRVEIAVADETRRMEELRGKIKPAPSPTPTC